MAAYSQKDIDDLIACPKSVSDPPKKDMRLVDADWRNDAKLVATNNTVGEFHVFMRKNADFPENFSIGLIYQPNDGSGEVVLLRCNGPHGIYNGWSGGAIHPHWEYHVHTASEKALEAGERAEKYAEKTTAYASFEEALPYFAKTVNLSEKDAHKYFGTQAVLPSELGSLWNC